MSAIVWQLEHSFALPFLGTGMKTGLFQPCGQFWVFQICWHIECHTFTASSFRIWNSSTGIPSLPLALFIVMLPEAHWTLHSRMSGSSWVTRHPGRLISSSRLISRWQSRTCPHLLLEELQNYNLLLNNFQQENIGFHKKKKKIPHIQGQRRSPTKTVGGAKSHLESNPIPTRDTWRAQTKLYAHQETPKKLSQTCLWVFECSLQGRKFSMVLIILYYTHIHFSKII